ncbi:MAG: hypothetical protein ACP5H7_03180 [Minisyncoccia bacterium]
MASRREHLKAVKKFLGWRPNVYVHILLDGGDLPKKLKIIYHKNTHDPSFIDKNISPPFFSEKDNLEAWFHLLHDLGFVKTEKK